VLMSKRGACYTPAPRRTSLLEQSFQLIDRVVCRAGFSLTQPPCPPREPRPAWGNPRPISFGVSVAPGSSESDNASPKERTQNATTAKKPPRMRSPGIHDRAGPNMENNDVRSHQDRRQAIPRRRQ
jgi:hypothetical protein